MLGSNLDRDSGAEARRASVSHDARYSQHDFRLSAPATNPIAIVKPTQSLPGIDPPSSPTARTGCPAKSPPLLHRTTKSLTQGRVEYRSNGCQVDAGFSLMRRVVAHPQQVIVPDHPWSRSSLRPGVERIIPLSEGLVHQQVVIVFQIGATHPSRERLHHRSLDVMIESQNVS